MTFENPGILWLLLVLPPSLFVLGFFGWRAKKEILAIFPLNRRRLWAKQVEKYIVSGVLMVLLILVLGLPEIGSYAAASAEKSGEVVLMVDVSASMAARADPDSPSRLDRTKQILYNIVDDMAELGQVKISLFGLTSMARSLVPLVGKEDYPYFKESIDKVLDINSVPGQGTSIGKPVGDVVEKLSGDTGTRIIVLFSNGEPFNNGMDVTYHEQHFIDQAVKDALNEGVKIITVGVGEKNGAKIPLYDSEGKFTGNYARLDGIDYVSYLEEDTLREIAIGTGGKYFAEQNMAGLISYIEDNLDQVNPRDAARGVKVYHPVTVWFLLASLPFMIIMIKRHMLG